MVFLFRKCWKIWKWHSKLIRHPSCHYILNTSTVNNGLKILPFWIWILESTFWNWWWQRRCSYIRFRRSCKWKLCFWYKILWVTCSISETSNSLKNSVSIQKVRELWENLYDSHFLLQPSDPNILFVHDVLLKVHNFINNSIMKEHESSIAILPN